MTHIKTGRIVYNAHYFDKYIRLACSFLSLDIYIFIAIALNESIFLDGLHFPMKNIKSRDLEATQGGATSKPTSDIVCLLLLA